VVVEGLILGSGTDFFFVIGSNLLHGDYGGGCAIFLKMLKCKAASALK
jgi:hypothetical protein